MVISDMTKIKKLRFFLPVIVRNCSLIERILIIIVYNNINFSRIIFVLRYALDNR